MQIPGINLSEIYEGRTLGDLWQFYTVNVKMLGTMSHEQFCREFPEGSKAIAKASAALDKLKALVEKEQCG